MPSPTYIPVIRTGVDVSFGNLTATGTLTVAGATTLNGSLSVAGFTGLAAAQTAGNFTVFGSALILGSAGTGLQIKEGANATSGIATLVAGTVTVNTNKVTANSRILLTSQVDGGTPGFQRVSARVAATSFTITSSNAADTSQVAWTLIEPAP